MGLSNYTDLKAAIINFLDRSDLDTYVDDFIDLAEARHKREILVRGMLARSQAPLGGRFIALPTRFVKMKTIRLLTTPITVLTELNMHELNIERDERTGKPSFYSVHEEIEFDVTPDDAYTLEMIYYASFVPLSDSQATNGLLTLAPDAYLYAALSASAPFLGADERLQVWETMYGNARDGLLLSDRQGRVGTPLTSRVAGATP